jgi:hypothetical protein
LGKHNFIFYSHKAPQLSLSKLIFLFLYNELWGAQGLFSNPQQLQQHNKTILKSTKHAREDLGKESKRGGIRTFEAKRALNLKVQWRL